VGLRQLMRDASIAIARPVGFLEYLFRRTDTSGDIFPTDSSSGVVPGANPERIIVLGESTAVGLGMLTHELGLAGHLARQYQVRTGRGVEWSTMGLPDRKLRSAPALIGDRTARENTVFEGTDIVVMMAGIADTLSLTSARRWRVQLIATLDALQRELPADAHVAVAEIPPMDNAGSISRTARMAAGAHARQLNEVTRSVIAQRTGASSIPFPQELTRSLWKPESQQASYLRMYTIWATGILEGLGVESERHGFIPQLADDPETTGTLSETLAVADAADPTPVVVPTPTA